MICEFSSSTVSRVRGGMREALEEAEALEEGCLLRGRRRRRAYVCLRLPADSLKTERSILGATEASLRRWMAEEEDRERLYRSVWEKP